MHQLELIGWGFNRYLDSKYDLWEHKHIQGKDFSWQSLEMTTTMRHSQLA
jgi:hypothetical protein